MEAHWWKCQIHGKEATQVFRKGDIVFAKKRNKRILLFDGSQKRGDLPRKAIRDIKILSLLDRRESEVIETKYLLARNLEFREI
jgi:hypothetical protein